jgi:hypothetical protein
MKLVLTATAAGSLRLPHSAGKFVFTPVCEQEIPEARATAMVKASPKLYVVATDATVKAAMDAAKNNKAVDLKAEAIAKETAKREAELKAAYDKGFDAGVKSVKAKA